MIKLYVHKLTSTLEVITGGFEMESYIRDELKKFRDEVEKKAALLINDIEPFMTNAFVNTVDISSKCSGFALAPERIANDLISDAESISRDYKDLPDLLNPALESIKNQFESLLSAHRTNFENYIAGVRKELVK